MVSILADITRTYMRAHEFVPLGRLWYIHHKYTVIPGLAATADRLLVDKYTSQGLSPAEHENGGDDTMCFA